MTTKTITNRKQQIKIATLVAVTAAAVAAASAAARNRGSGHDPNDQCALCRAESAFSPVAASTDLASDETAKMSADKTTTGNRSPVLVELFTSEGCSSCPPADALLQELQSKQSIPGARIIAISEHVDYWDRLGWKDPYSSADYSARQSEYARSFKNDQVYTPQIVVDGQAEFVGSDKNAARTAITRAGKTPKATIRLAAKGGVFSVNITDLPRGAATSDVYVAVTENNLSSSVRNGENAGRRLRHTAVARQLVRIGTVSPGKSFNGTFRPKGPGSRMEQNVVAFVQERETRRVIGVEEVPIGS